MAMRVTLREFVRHSLHRAGILEPLRKMRSGVVHKGEGESLADRFQYIYDQGIWQTTPDAPLSGAGSHPSVAARLGAQLPELIKEFGVKEFLDIGCGDFSWMQNVELGCNYTGIDIVPSVIARNSELFGRPGRRFLTLDAVSQPVPTADMLLCREVLFHLSFADARALLSNACQSGAKWLLATTDTATRFNADIESGDFRVLNLSVAPFHFPPPVRRLADDGLVAGRTVGLWSIPDLSQR